MGPRSSAYLQACLHSRPSVTVQKCYRQELSYFESQNRASAERVFSEITCSLLARVAKESHRKLICFVVCSSWTNKLIKAKDHASVQINVGHLDGDGVYNGQFSTFALAGNVRAMVSV